MAGRIEALRAAMAAAQAKKRGAVPKPPGPQTPPGAPSTDDGNAAEAGSGL